VVGAGRRLDYHLGQVLCWRHPTPFETQNRIASGEAMVLSSVCDRCRRRRRGAYFAGSRLQKNTDDHHVAGRFTNSAGRAECRPGAPSAIWTGFAGLWYNCAGNSVPIPVACMQPHCFLQLRSPRGRRRRP